MTARKIARNNIGIDWEGLALALRRRGRSLRRVSLDLGKSEGWLQQFVDGGASEPYFGDGVMLLNYAYDHLGPDELRKFGPYSPRNGA